MVDTLTRYSNYSLCVSTLYADARLVCRRFLNVWLSWPRCKRAYFCNVMSISFPPVLRPFDIHIHTAHVRYILNAYIFVRGRGIVFRHYYRSLAKSAGKDFRDGAVVPFE
jgi:hypothetical protein